MKIVGKTAKLIAAANSNRHRDEHASELVHKLVHTQEKIKNMQRK
jgi:hypothetical protein